MKAVKDLGLLIFLFLSLLISCKGEDQDTLPTPHKNTFSAKVNGAPFEATELVASLDNNYFGLTGIAKNKHEIILVTNTNNTRTGHYILNTYDHGFSGGYYEGVGGYHAIIEGISGNLTISRIDKSTYKNGTVID